MLFFCCTPTSLILKTSRMGCCFSSCLGRDEDEICNERPNETTGLLKDPVANESPIRSAGSFHTESLEQSDKVDEQSKLSRILQETARNIIDVAAMEPQTMEQNEYYDKAKLYSEKLNGTLSGMARMRSYKAQLPYNTNNPQMILSAQPLPSTDLLLIQTAAERVYSAMQDIKVQHKDDLVVPFRVP